MDIEVKMGDFALGKEADNLMVSAIGSCLVITLYDHVLKIGSLAHTMITSDSIDKKRNTKYVDVAIDEMNKTMTAHGSRKENLEAKLIGGANMFSNLDSDIGQRNVLCAREKLKKESIPIVGTCVYGSQGRSVEFSIAQGIVTVKTVL